MSLLTDRQTFRERVAEVAEKARARLPQNVNGRIESAMALVLACDVMPQADGSILIGSSRDPLKSYLLTGSTCECQDFVSRKAPDGWCKHRIAAGIHKRVGELLPVQDDRDHLATPEGGSLQETPAPVEAPHGIDPRHIVLIQGKPFVKFAGLLELAHQKGLQELRVHWTFNSEDLSLAHAVAIFPHGTFEECGDASPASVNRKVALHFRRVACTRAAARALRLALGVEVCSVEELADEAA